MSLEMPKRAVELTSEFCNENDNCEYCEDRRMYLEDLKYFQRTYHKCQISHYTWESGCSTYKRRKEGGLRTTTYGKLGVYPHSIASWSLSSAFYTLPNLPILVLLSIFFLLYLNSLLAQQKNYNRERNIICSHIVDGEARLVNRNMTIRPSLRIKY